jgi:oligosaccharide 4-alpha-D-glucosyltransferase
MQLFLLACFSQTMIMKKWLAVFLLFVAATAVAQERGVVAPRPYPAATGKYSVHYYSDNIVKLTFTPDGYSKNENISDAVILKPVSGSNGLHVEISEPFTNIGGKAVLFDIDTAGGYYCFNFALRQDEMIFGGGERALPLNRRGYRFNLYNNPWYGYGEGADNLNYSVPFFTSNKGYGLFFDNPSKGFVDIGKENSDVFKVGFSSGELNVYVILGKDYREILESYHKLTGTQPLPPRWVFGNLMSRFGYTSEAQAKDILARMQRENIPVDAIIFDLFWFGDSIKGTLGNLEWKNKNKWPDPGKMISDFNKKGVKTILVTEPFFVETSKNYEASKKYAAVDSSGRPYYLTDFYFGKGGLIDIFRKDSKDWFWNFYKKQMDIGVEAWWGDLGEPEKHPKNLYHNLSDLGQKRLFAADEVHNIYGHTWTKMLYEKYAKEYPNKRLFSLNRSGFAGSQRYGIFPWTGDVSRSWSGLSAQLPVLLGMSMSGVPYVHSDAGGFAGGDGDNELYVRWLQFAVFTPVFRPHGTALYEVEPAAKSFPSEAALIDTPWREYAKQAINLRYQFRPYNYTLAYKQHVNGKPLIAPLYYAFSNDTIASKIEDQFLWGEDIMVAPIINKSQSVRKYYLPEGNWLRLFEDMPPMKNGASWYTDSVGLEDIPVFLRAGAFLCLEPPAIKSRIFKLYDYEIIHPFSSKPSSGILFLDDGISKNSLSTNKYRLISFASRLINQDTYEITIQSKGNYQSGKVVSFSLLIPGFDKTPVLITVNGKPKKFLWNKQTNSIALDFDNTGSTRIVIKAR